MKLSAQIIFTVVLTTIAASWCALNAAAEASISRVPQGATSKEVIMLLGAPQEQVERETKRQKVWYYADGSIVFVNGKARSIYPNGSVIDSYIEQQEQRREAIKAAPKASSSVDDIISEILREVPSESMTDSSASAVPGDASKPLEIQR